MNTKLKLITGVLLFSFNVFLVFNAYADRADPTYCCCSDVNENTGLCVDFGDGLCNGDEENCPSSWQHSGDTYYLVKAMSGHCEEEHPDPAGCEGKTKDHPPKKHFLELMICRIVGDECKDK